jgi:hypothetical protein
LNSAGEIEGESTAGEDPLALQLQLFHRFALIKDVASLMLLGSLISVQIVSKKVTSTK